MFRIVASDLDGTLLSPDNCLTSFARETLQLLIDKGIHFVFATGRHHINVIQIRKHLGIDAYMITSNGARVHNTNGELVFAYDLKENVAAQLFYIANQDPQIITNVFRNDAWFVNRKHLYTEELDSKCSFTHQIYKKGDLPADGVCKVYFTSDNYNKLLILEKLLNSLWGDCINVSFSLPICLEVMAGGVSKGNALKEVAKLLGYELQDCISFGDGMNDQEMLAMAGKGCIMYNAHQRLKDQLPLLEVIGSNNDEAVPCFLRTMYL